MGTQFRWIEALCLASVIMATTWVEFSFSDSEEIIDPVISLDGYVQLSTRSSMDSLNLKQFDVGAKASFELQMTQLEPEKCENCLYELEGKRITGTVVITELIDEQGRSGRIEADLNISHIEERDSDGFLLQEWFVFDWDAGASSFNQMIHVIHSSTPWSDEQASSSFLIDTTTGSESRTGPNLIKQEISESQELVRACLPDSFTCNGISNWDIEMNVNRGNIGESLVVQSPSSYSEISIPNNLEFSDSGFLGSWVNLSETDVPITSNCLVNPGNINSAGSWEIDGSGSGIISPLSSVLSSAGIPVLQIQIGLGVLTVLEGDSGTCSQYIADDSIAQILMFED